MLSVPGNKRQLVVFECLIPFVREQGAFDNFNFKFPMFLVAMAMVFLYQFINRKGPEPELGGGLVNEFERAAGGKKMTLKQKQDLAEIEAMIGGLGDMG